MSDGTNLDLGPPKQQAVLAVLLLHANEIVSTEQLIEQVWPERPPRTAAHSIQIYVSDLRKTFEPHAGAPLIATRPPGYLLEADPDHIDAERFVQLVAEGVRELHDSDRAGGRQALRSALGMWRGPPLSDFTYEEFAQPYVRRLTKLRLDALEELATAELDRGRPQEALPLLETAVGDDPLRERCRELRMLALYRAGRHAEALREYQQFRKLLDEELGLDPSPALRRLEERVLLHDPSLLPPASADGAEVRNPYKGLRAFGEDDAEDFFGRQATVDELVTALAAGSRLAALVGPSGSGKSSVLAAGLVPAIRAGAVPGSATWGIASMVPGRHPSEALDTALNATAGDVAGDDVLVLVDQFEEVFSLPDDTERQRFLDHVVALVTSSEGRIRIALTLRADYYDRALLHGEFGRMLTGGQVNVLPMTADELEAAVARPAERVSVGVETGLVAALVSDAVAQPGALPLLQYALTEMFDDRTGGSLTLDEYHTLRRLRGLLARRAENLYAGLDDTKQSAVLQLFLRLVHLGQGGRVTRRRTPLAELTAVDVDPVTLSEVLDELGRHRLLSYDRDPVSGDATVEVAHDALLTEWPRLAGWLDHYRDDMRRQAALGIAVEDWESSGRQDDYLFTGSRLAEYDEWSKDTVVQLTAPERKFLGAGVQRRDAELTKEAAHRDEQHRLERRARTRLVALFVAVILLAGGATVGVFAWLRNRPPEAVAVLPTGGGVFAAMVHGGFTEGIAAFDIRGDISIVPDDEVADEIAGVSDRGVDLVITSQPYCAPVESIAAAHPDTQYLAFDCIDAIGDLPNVTYASFATEQGSFLAGAAAALKSETGVIGFVGGVEVSMIEQFRAGYEAGARAVDPGIDIRSEYLTEPPDFSGFGNETLGFQAAERLYRGGADIVFHAAGVAGFGVFEAATQLSPELGRQLWVIGVDTDQGGELSADDPWKPHILTSMQKRYDRATSVVVGEYSRGVLTPGARVSISLPAASTSRSAGGSSTTSSRSSSSSAARSSPARSTCLSVPASQHPRRARVERA